MQIREYQQSDWDQLWRILEPIIRAGETYAYAPDITQEEAHRVWVELPQRTYVTIDSEDTIVGTYYIKPNQPGLGAHVCNCGYIVSEHVRGKGIASAMCKHSQQVAMVLGFRAMQYNLVISTNEGAIHLWKKHGFEVIGVLPKAFYSMSHGFVDAMVMYKQLTS